MSEVLVNKVEQSGLIQLDIKNLINFSQEIIEYDIAQNLFQGLLLREKDFRDFIKSNDWSVYEGKHVGIVCSADALIPNWAFMLLVVALNPFALSVTYGAEKVVLEKLLTKAVDSIDLNLFKDRKVVVKGCSDIDIPESTYAEISQKLLPVVQSLMFGEPCSVVPVYKRKRLR